MAGENKGLCFRLFYGWGCEGSGVNLLGKMDRLGLVRDLNYQIEPYLGDFFDDEIFSEGLTDLCDGVFLEIIKDNVFGLNKGLLGGFEMIGSYLERNKELIIEGVQKYKNGN